jgi:hypothetical protein
MDDAHDVVMMTPSGTDEQVCLLCGEPAVAWPEKLTHLNAWIDDDHEPLIDDLSM